RSDPWLAGSLIYPSAEPERRWRREKRSSPYESSTARTSGPRERPPGVLLKNLQPTPEPSGRKPTMNLKNRIRCVVLCLLAALVLTSSPALAAEGKKQAVNLNSAAASQLALLPRVGPAVAQRIVAFRKEHGPF